MTSQGGLPWRIMRRGWTQNTWRMCILEEEMGSLKAWMSQGKLLFLVESEKKVIVSIALSKADED